MSVVCYEFSTFDEQFLKKIQLEQDLLASIPAWETEAGRPFLVHGESILQILMETVSAQDQENKRKPPRAGFVPPRATTPVNSAHAYVPGSKTGTVTPAVRPGSTSQSVPNKRQKLGESAPSGQLRQGSGGKGDGNAPPHYGGRVPLGLYRGGNEGGRAVSPSKIPGRSASGHSSMPRPAAAAVAMPVPKPGTQHHALGHGRLPSGVGYGGSYVAGARSTSGMTSGGYGSRYTSGSGYAAAEVMKKASRARRESFRPRPSMDGLEIGVSVGLGGQRSRWPGLGSSVKEEDEG